MAYPFTEDHDMIREAARGFLQDWYEGGKGPERIYQSEDGIDRAAWNSFAGELGMAGIAIDEAYGGAGLGDLGRVVVMEELGASLCAIPFLTAGGIAPDVIAACGDEAVKSEMLGRIASGELIATYCDGHNAMMRKGEQFGGGVNHIPYLSCADVILMSLRRGEDIEIVAVPTDVSGLAISTFQTLDPTRNFGNIILDVVNDSDVQHVGILTEAALDDVIQQSFVALAAECLGGAQKCLDMTLEYAGQRVQFGRPIASFQAIKHRCADMFILIEAARSAVYAAAVAPPQEKTEAAIIAKAYATDAFFKVAGDAIQMHGGIGFTWEYPLHFFFKRARANRSMFGSSDRDYDRLAGHVFGDAA